MATSVLLASSRSFGNARQMVSAGFQNMPHALEDLNAMQVGYYSYEHLNEGDDFRALVERISESNLWVIATPLYWYSMSAQAKTFLDRLTDLLELHKETGRRIRDKSLAVLCSGTDKSEPNSFEEPFVLSCNYLQMKFLGSYYMQFEGKSFAKPDLASSLQAFVRKVVADAA